MGPDALNEASPRALATDDGSVPAPRRAANRWAVAVIGGLVLLPFVVLAIRIRQVSAADPLGDQALVALRVADVGGAHTPLVGSYQRFGWNQPGPLFFYLFAVPYRLFGTDYAALQLGALLVNLASVVGIGVVAWRRFGSLVALFTLALIGVLLNAMGPELIADPWEPSVTILLVAVTVYLCCDVGLGRAWSIPVLAAVTSLLAQAYATLTAVALVLLAAGVIGYFVVAWARTRHFPAWRTWRLPALIAVAVFVVLWIPPLVEQLRDDPGNVTLMWRFFRSDHALLGLPDAYRALSLQLGIRPPWAGFAVPLHAFDPLVNLDAATVVPIALVALAVAAVVAVIRRDRSIVLVAMVAVALAAEWVALSRLIGGVFSWLLQPSWALGLLAWLAVGTVLLVWLPRRGGRVRTVVRGVLLAGLAVVCVVNTAAALDYGPTQTSTAKAVHAVARRSVPYARQLHGPVLVESTIDRPDVPFGRVGTEVLALTLDRAGVPVRVPTDLANHYGRFRAAPHEAVGELRLGLATDRPAGWTRVAAVDRLTPAKQRERDRLQRRLQAVAGPIDTAAQRLAVLVAHPDLRAPLTRWVQLDSLPRIAVYGRRLTPAG